MNRRNELAGQRITRGIYVRKTRKIVLTTCLALGVASCLATSPARRYDNVDVARAFSKAAVHINAIDWEGYEEPVEAYFRPQELEILAAHADALSPMIESALTVQHSVWGAKLAAHFGLAECLPFLLQRFLQPGQCYGWEISDERIASPLADHQFQYHTTYLKSIEAITGNPIAETVFAMPYRQPGFEDDIRTILRLAGDPNVECHYWGVWMSRKLNLDSESSR